MGPIWEHHSNINQFPYDFAGPDNVFSISETILIQWVNSSPKANIHFFELGKSQDIGELIGTKNRFVVEGQGGVF